MHLLLAIKIIWENRQALLLFRVCSLGFIYPVKDKNEFIYDIDGVVAEIIRPF